MNKLAEQMKKLNSYEPEHAGKLDIAETYLLLFLTGSVIGWIYELFFYWIFENRISNNGFFYGPYLPIYGFCALLIVVLTRRFKKHPIAIFLLTIPITGILEYVTGYAMYELWATRWWDYQGKFLNIGGFVCLRSVITFAVGAIALIYVIEPLIWMLSSKVSKRAKHIICISILVIFAIDMVATILFRMPAFA